jgi:hypothetical protein
VPATLARVDLTADYEMDDPTDVPKVLSALASLDLPRWPQRIVFPGSSVTWQTTSRGREFAAYDKTRERRSSGVLFPEGRLRLERQLRQVGAEQPSVFEFTNSSLADEFLRPFRDWPVELLVVASPRDAYDELNRRTSVKGSRSALPNGIIATLAMLEFGGDEPFRSARNGADRLRALRQRGICVDRSCGQPVDLGEILLTGHLAWREFPSRDATAQGVER